MSSAEFVTLTTAALELRIAVDAGARVLALIDRHTGRNWLAEGPAPDAGRAVYGVDEAAGWDECFPTVSPCDGRATPWARPLRDHGDLWGRASTTSQPSDHVLETTFVGEGFRFFRRLTLVGAAVEIDYGVETSLDQPTPFLWAMHPLFALLPGEAITLDGVKSLSADYLTLNGAGLEPGRISWPTGDGRIPFALDRVQDCRVRFAGKFFADDAFAQRASLGGPLRWLDLQWDGVDHLGLWLTYGAWPESNEIVHVAVEPTTSPDDTLTEAIANSRAAFVSPGERKSWRVRMSLRTD